MQNHLDSVLLEKYQSRSNQIFKHNSADTPSLNLTINFSFGTRLFMFIINGYCTKNKRSQSLDFLFYLCSGDFPFKFCHHIIVKARVGFASQVDYGQLGNPALTPYFKLGPSWLHFYHTSQVDSREHNLCPVIRKSRF